MAVGWWAKSYGAAQMALKRWTMDASGVFETTATMAASLKRWTMDASGWMDPLGDMVATLPKWTMDAGGTQAQSGTMVASLPKWAMDAAGSMVNVAGPMAAVLPKWTMTAAGGQTQSGAMAATLPKWTMDGSGIGALEFGTMAASLPKWTMTASGAAVSSPTVSGSTAVDAASVTIPAHAVGDLIIISAARPSTTQASKPVAGGTVPAWNDIDAPAGANANSMRTAWFVATATNHTSGTWTNATHMTATVVKNPKTARPIGAHVMANGAATTSPVAPAATLLVNDGTSLVLRIFSAGGTPTGYNAAPSGYTRQSSSNGAAVDTQNTTTSAGTETESAITSTVYCATTIELVSSVSVLPPPFDAVGPGSSTSGGTYTHPAGAANRTVLAYVILESVNTTAPTVTTPPKCAGVNMNLIKTVDGSANDAFGAANRFLCYSLTGQAATALTITAPVPAGAASIECNTVSYAFVGSVGTPSSNTAVANPATITGTAAATSIFSCGIGFEEVKSSSNQTQRFEVDTGSANSGLWIAESPGGAQTFNLTMAAFTGGAVPDVFMAILVELTGTT